MWHSDLPDWAILKPIVAFVMPWVKMGRWLDGSLLLINPAAPLSRMDLILGLVFWGVVLTVVGNVITVIRHAVSPAGLPSWLSARQTLHLATTFMVLMYGVSAWLFSSETRSLAQYHWALTCGVATTLTVEHNTRIMLALTTKDEGVLSSYLSFRSLVFSAVPLAMRWGVPKALGLPPRDFAAGALLACGVAALVPCVAFIFAACTEVAAALGIHTFSIPPLVDDATAASAAPIAAAKGAGGSESGDSSSSGGRGSGRSSSSSARKRAGSGAGATPTRARTPNSARGKKAR